MNPERRKFTKLMKMENGKGKENNIIFVSQVAARNVGQ
jgi:hypothetical protein